jgi:phage terminase large subunit-like protein
MSKSPLYAVAGRDYAAFVQVCHIILHGFPLDEEKYFQYLCSVAQQFADGKRKRVIANLPPGFGKTTILTICMVAWLFGRNPKLRLMLVMLDAELTREIVESVRRIMKSDEYAEIFGARIAKGNDTVDGFRTRQGGKLFACSIQGGITGRRSDVVIVDDVLAIKQAGNVKWIREINRIFDKEIFTRLSDPEQGRVLVVMHRLHQEDLTAHLVEKGGYDLIALPLVADRERTFRYNGLEWRWRRGEQLRNGHYSMERIQQLKEEEGSPDFYYLYQQAVGRKAELRIQARHFPLVEFRKLPLYCPVVFSIDTSQKDGPTASSNVILVIIRSGRDDIILDEFCARCDYVALYKAFHVLAQQYRPSAVLIEATANGTALISQLKDENEYRIEEVIPKGSKTKRLRRHLRHIRGRHVHLPQRTPWFGAFVGDFLNYPAGSTDRIDALTQYLDFRATDPKLALATPRPLGRSGPAGVGSFGPLRNSSTRPRMEVRGAVMVTASSISSGPPRLTKW